MKARAAHAKIFVVPYVQPDKHCFGLLKLICKMSIYKNSNQAKMKDCNTYPIHHHLSKSAEEQCYFSKDKILIQKIATEALIDKEASRIIIAQKCCR
jgi:hypothetical protein